MSEKQIQHKCVLWFSQQFPERRGDVFATFQETINGAQGSNMLSLGLIPGVSDLILINDGIMSGIEMKAPDTKHDIAHVLEQSKFILNNCYDGWFCVSLPMFQDIINKTGLGIDPLDVVRKCEDALDKKIELHGGDDIDDLLFKINQWIDKEYPKRKRKHEDKIKKMKLDGTFKKGKTKETFKKSDISIGTIKF